MSESQSSSEQPSKREPRTLAEDWHIHEMLFKAEETDPRVQRSLLPMLKHAYYSGAQCTVCAADLSANHARYLKLWLGYLEEVRVYFEDIDSRVANRATVPLIPE